MQPNRSDPSTQKLPIFKYKDQIVKNLKDQSAIIISGLTGCGKSTQVPQYLLDAYPNASIAVCEPRRLAATSLAIRVCQQRKTRLGQQVGYQIGLQAKRSDKTRLVYMTYGILIQELLFKEKLEYDFVILDEVHERSLQMDFAFVILKKIINQDLKLKQKSQKSKIQSESIQGLDTQKDVRRNQQKTKKKTNENLKLIIMSATLNSDQFQKYFAVHKITNLIIQPEVTIKQADQIVKRRGGRNGQKRRGNLEYESVADPKKQITIKYANLEEYRQGICIFIDEKSSYTVKQYFLQDFLPYFQQKAPTKNYQNPDEIRLDDKQYDWGLKIIEKAHRDIQYALKNNEQKSAKTSEAGDILVFLPGLIEINRMKQALIAKNKLFAQKIVEVHSLFSQQLYFKLFKSPIKNKIILATNIGQSSITLPNCKVVIDYCLNRKAVKNSKQGISRFTTTLASQSNLIQRKGRVGRVSDGIVYRMITKIQFDQLQQFDYPEIKCVSLEMAILKTKKLQSTSKSHIFQDIYDIFLNVLEPPEVQSIEAAIDNLIHQDALQYMEQSSFQKEGHKVNHKQEKRKINSGKKYDGKSLKISKVGQFMVSMPCDLGVSKLILMGIKLGIPSIIIDIAAIILSTKSFFCHESKIFNVEEFMHSMIGYDKGDNNDYLLRQRLFDHWRTRFYIPYREKQRLKQPKLIQKPSNLETSFRIFDFGQEVEFDENYKIVDSFVRKNESEEERNFCKNKGVYANHMRELLRLSETLKIRIEMLGLQKSKLNTFQPQAELVLICLMYGFPDLICQVNFQAKKRQISHYLQEQEHFNNRVHIPLVQGLDDQELQSYLDPQKDYEVKEHKDSLMVTSYNHVLKKFLLPKHYTKAQIDKCSMLFKHCRTAKVKYPYEYNIYHGFSNITVMNESINKEILISPQVFLHNHIQNMYLISNNVIQSKGRYMVGANALVSNFQLVIISMIVKKNILICLHPSGEFFSQMKLNEKKFQIPLLLTEEQLSLINKLRALSKRKKQEEIASYKEQFDKDQLKTLSNLFKFNNIKSSQEDWQQIFIQEEYRARRQDDNKTLTNDFYDHMKEKWLTIEHAENKMREVKGKPYYKRYNDWKKYLYESTERQLKLHSTTEAILICGHCNGHKKLVEVASAFSFEFNTKLLKLNRYSGSWVCPESKSEDIDQGGLKIFCSNMHQVGVSIDSDYAEIDVQNIYLFVPFNEVYGLNKIQSREQYAQILSQAKEQSLRILRIQHQKFDSYECKICFNKESQRKVFNRYQLEQKRERKNPLIKDPLWNAIVNHMTSTSHLNSKEKLKRSIDWDLKV